MTKKGTDLFVSSNDKIYRIDTNSTNPVLNIVASNICGTAGFDNSTLGIKIYGDFLYVMDCNGIIKINLSSESFQQNLITTYSGNSFAKSDNDNVFYLTNLNIFDNGFESIYRLDVTTQELTFVTSIAGFIGTYDIFELNNKL